MHGDDFYSRIGAKGGRNGHTGGFASNRELASIAGAKGGRNSRRDEAKSWYDKNEDLIRKMFESGLNTSQVARKIGVTTQRMYYVISKYGGDI